MSTLNEIEAWVAGNLSALIQQYDVPGAAVAVLSGGHVIDHAAGILNTSTGVEATADSVLEIGSITKLWSATRVKLHHNRDASGTGRGPAEEAPAAFPKDRVRPEWDEASSGSHPGGYTVISRAIGRSGLVSLS